VQGLGWAAVACAAEVGCVELSSGFFGCTNLSCMSIAISSRAWWVAALRSVATVGWYSAVRGGTCSAGVHNNFLTRQTASRIIADGTLCVVCVHCVS